MAAATSAFCPTCSGSTSARIAAASASALCCGRSVSTSATVLEQPRSRSRCYISTTASMGAAVASAIARLATRPTLRSGGTGELCGRAVVGA